MRNIVSASVAVLVLLAGCSKDGETSGYTPRGGGSYSSTWGRISEKEKDKQEAKRRDVDRFADSRYDYRIKRPVVSPLPDGGYQVAFENRSTVTFDASGTGTGSETATDEDLLNAAYAVREFKQRNQGGFAGPASSVLSEPQ